MNIDNQVTLDYFLYSKGIKRTGEGGNPYYELKNYNLNGQTIKDCQIKDVEFNNCQIREMIFENVEFYYCKFINTPIEDCEFINCKFINGFMGEGNFIYNNFNYTEFTHFNLSSVFATSNEFNSCDFLDDDYNFVDFRNCKFDNCRFNVREMKQPHLNNTIIRDCEIKDLCINGAKAHNLQMLDTKLDKFRMIFSDLTGASFGYTALTETNFKGSNLKNASFTQCEGLETKSIFIDGFSKNDRVEYIPKINRFIVKGNEFNTMTDFKQWIVFSDILYQDLSKYINAVEKICKELDIHI